MHSDINPVSDQQVNRIEAYTDPRHLQGNILITEEGNARLGDFGIIGIITDPTVMELGGTTTSKPGVCRYMAPELLNPSQFHLSNSNPSKESDIYSFAITAFEVRLPTHFTWSPLILSLCQVLTGILPYGNNRDGIIAFHVVTGERPTRPANARWLEDHIWTMITACWSESREQRWGIHAVYNQFLASATEVSDLEPGNRCVSRNGSGLKGLFPVHRC